MLGLSANIPLVDANGLKYETFSKLPEKTQTLLREKFRYPSKRRAEEPAPAETTGEQTMIDSPVEGETQPPPPKNTTTSSHMWPQYYTVQWIFAFVPDDNDAPPYFPLPRTPYNLTTGRTYYDDTIDPEKGVRNMREDYDKYCIPVFGDPTNPMGAANNFKCSFLNVGITNTSYVILYEDRPQGAPECCIIGQPFYPPPRDWVKAMPVKWRDQYNDMVIDYNAVYDNEAGIFNYGFESSTSVPFVFLYERSSVDCKLDVAKI